MKHFKVVVTDYPTQYDFQLEKEILAVIGAELYTVDCRTEQEVLDCCQDADAVMTVYAPVGARAVGAFSRCRIIARYGVGVDNIDIPAATRRGIVVVNVPDYCMYEVALHTVSLVLCLSRRILILHHEVTVRHNWDVAAAKPVFRLKGQTLGLVGFGRIAQVVADLVKGFDLSILAFDPYVNRDVAEVRGVQLVELEDLLVRSDFVSVHAPLTAETKYLIGKSELQKMKPTAFLINTARAAIVDQKVLYQALKNGWIAGAGLDVLEEEPPKESNPLLSLDNVVITPHAASYSIQSYQEVRERATQEVVRVLSGKWPRPIAFLNPEVKNRVWWAKSNH